MCAAAAPVPSIPAWERWWTPGGALVPRARRPTRKRSVRHALAALDGELSALGTQAGGAPWAMALEHPAPGRRTVQGVIEPDQLAVATSGDYRRYLSVGAARLAHTMDPQRCAPVNNVVASVTVLASSCMQADGLQALGLGRFAAANGSPGAA